MVDRQETRATVCDECGSGLLDGDHIADYACSKRSRQETREALETEWWENPETIQRLQEQFKPDGLLRLARSSQEYYDAHGHYLPGLAALALTAYAECDRLAARVNTLTEALREIKAEADRMIAGGTISGAYLGIANRARAALASGVPADEETT